MKFYIVDDVRSIVKVLDRIIEEKKLGEVVGFATDAVTATAEIICMKPDIVLVDLLMPVKDGISIVKEVKQLCPQTNFIMISQVSNKEMVSEAYNAGVEFFIHKPINIIEVEKVIGMVSKQIEMEKTLGGLRNILGVSEATVESSKKTAEGGVVGAEGHPVSSGRFGHDGRARHRGYTGRVPALHQSGDQRFGRRGQRVLR